MADELQITTMLNYTGSSISVRKGSSSILIDVTGADFIHGTQNIDTSAEAIDKGNITTPGYIWVKNLDSTNFVEIGYDDTGFKNVVKLKAGEEAIFRLAQSTPQAQADTAAVDIEYVMIED